MISAFHHEVTDPTKNHKNPAARHGGDYDCVYTRGLGLGRRGGRRSRTRWRRGCSRQIVLVVALRAHTHHRIYEGYFLYDWRTQEQRTYCAILDYDGIELRDSLRELGFAEIPVIEDDDFNIHQA
jgi:hypothetical protein